MLQYSLDIAYSPFSLSELRTLEVLFPPSGTPMNITILYYPIYYITYLSQVPAMYPITDQFPMYVRQNIYVLAIYNVNHSLVSTAVQLLWDEQKCAISSYVTRTLDQRRPSALTSLEEHFSLFDQVHPVLEPNRHYHEVFFTTTPEKPSTFGQTLKGPDRINWTKCAYTQYDKSISFSILTATFYCEKWPSTTCIL